MPQVTYRKDYRPYGFVVEHCQLRFEILADCVLVSSRLQMKRNLQQQSVDCLLDGGVGLEIVQLQLDGQDLQQGSGYQRTEQGLTLLGTASKEAFVFSAQVRIDPYHNTALEGLYQSGKILCSQNEAAGFRHITFYPDRPDVMSRFDTEIIADQKQYPCLLSNGNLIQQKQLDGGRHCASWQDPFAKPCYLYAIVAGDLDVLPDQFTTQSGRQVELRIYTDKGRTNQARFAMDSLKQAMKWDEQRFGREYDLDLFMIVAVDSFNFGAMENKGLNIFNSSLIFASSKTATDSTFEAIAGVVAHEYFHNWTGNRITCRDWFQLTLKEGLTVYRDELFSEDQFGREVYRIQQVRNLRENQYPEDTGPNRHPIRPDSFVDINNFYTQTVYEKGAAVIRMMASYLGAEGFRKGMDCYFERFDGQAVTCDDFVAAIAEGGGKDLTPFAGWYRQAGTPQLYATAQWNNQTREFVLHLRQEQPHAASTDPQPEPLAFPLPLTLYCGHSGQKLRQENPLITQSKTTLRYILPTSNSNAQTDQTNRPVPSLLLGHISPLEVHYDYSDEELLLLATCDQDSFNRYEAVQKYLKNLLLNSVKTNAENTPASLPEPFVAMLRCCLQQQLANSKPDQTENAAPQAPRFLASLLQPPSVQVLAQAQLALHQPPQFYTLHQLRENYCRQLAQALENEMLACYQALTPKQYSRSQAKVGQRSLRNVLLHFLARLSDAGDAKYGAKYHDLAWQQYQSCDNMTDSYSALQSLANWPGQHSQAALEHFIQRWQDDFQVTCRWFALQAAVPRPETPDRILALEQHRLFQQQNPNMLRSLYSVLGRNLAVFHHQDGRAYDLLAQRIIAIDSYNSMIAAGLAKSYVAFATLPEPQKTAMSLALQKIAEQPQISERLGEIVSNTLK